MTVFRTNERNPQPAAPAICVVVLIHILVSISGCGKSPPDAIVLKADIVDLVERLEVRRLRDGRPIGTAESIKRKSGDYIVLDFVPKKMLPEAIEGKKVRAPEQWPFAFLIYPKGTSFRDSGTECLFFVPYSEPSPFAPARGEEHLPVVSGVSGFWIENGCTGQPKLAAGEEGKKKPGEIQRWSYLSLPSSKDDDSFEFVLVCWPCFEQTKASSVDLNSPLVVKRGSLTLEK